MYELILNRFGVTQYNAESFVFIGIAVIAIGFVLLYFWQYMIAGAFAVAIMSVALHHVPEQGMVASKSEPVAEQKTQMTDKESYLRDCEALTNKSDICEEIWDEDREQIVLKGIPDKKEIVQVVSGKELLNVDNAEYKERRAQALKKPGAVVMQTTFSDHDR